MAACSEKQKERNVSAYSLFILETTSIHIFEFRNNAHLRTGPWMRKIEDFDVSISIYSLFYCLFQVQL